MSSSTKVFFPDLDGLRFFAFFAVFINHAVGCLGYHSNSSVFEYIHNHFLKNGDLGVSFFFVLSGFLITYLLLKEKEISGKIHIGNFYIRRVLRIWPIYFLIVGLCLLVFPHLQSVMEDGFPIGSSTANLNPYFYLTFTGNFDYLYNGITNFLIGILWSVSIEEQFYLFWPLVIAFVPKKYLLQTFSLIIFGSIAFRYFYANGNIMIIKFHSFSCVSDLASGAVIAYLAMQEHIVEKVRRLPKKLIILIYCMGFSIMPLRLYTWKLGIYYAYAASLTPVIFSAFFAFIIMEQNFAEHSFFKVSRLKRISSLGKYTYGMYCYHMISFFIILLSAELIGVKIVGMNGYTFTVVLVLSMLYTVFLSKISYVYFESQFLKLKSRFSIVEKE